MGKTRADGKNKIAIEDSSKKPIKNKQAKVNVIVKNKKKNVKRKPFKENINSGGLIYLGHIPHGFYEDEMKSYFNQFGRVVAATVARSKKTGRSRGYGFVEFEDEDVAKIAAETMNNYLMFNRIIKCRFIPHEERKGKLFVRNINCQNYPRKKNRIENCKNKTKALSKLDQSSYLKKTQKKIEEFKKFFEDRGIDFSFKVANKEEDEAHKNDNSKMKSPSQISLDSEMEDETDDQFGVLEIDESDNEIFFKTPPQVKKVIKRSVDSPSVSLQEFNQFVKSPVNKNKAKKSGAIVSNKNKAIKNGKVSLEKPKKKDIGNVSSKNGGVKKGKVIKKRVGNLGSPKNKLLKANNKK